MKKIVLALVLMFVGLTGFAQDVRFYKKLNSFCEKRLSEFDLNSKDRKLILDSIAASISKTKGKVLVGCETNTRRTQLMSI
ncbi:MAG: hypothetical protein NT150_14285 [Bacteroidetes bacterium]|nr:hypothetical protein [Bacteroidota bacterium]